MIFIIWFIMGVLSAIVAEGKGRNAGVWFALGFLFSFIALIIVVLLPPINNNNRIN